MRAVQFAEYGPPSVVHVAEVEEPHAGPGEIRIAVRASGLSVGETALRSGRLRDVVPLTLPYRTGFDAAGVVDEIGAGVRGVVEFRASYVREREPGAQHERSRFVREAGRWLYVDGVALRA